LAVEECLAHPYFEEIRDKEYETVYTAEKLDFAFEKGEKKLDELKLVLYEEMMQFHPEIKKDDRKLLKYPIQDNKYLMTIDLNGKFIKISNLSINYILLL